MDMTFKLQVFEGPLDLLLYLIEKNKVNCRDYSAVHGVCESDEKG